MDFNIYKFHIYSCGCGFESTHPGNASRHKKILCGHKMNDEIKEFIEKSEHFATQKLCDEYTTIKTTVLNQEREQHAQLVSQLKSSNQNLKTSLGAMDGKFRRALAKMSRSAYIDEDVIEDDLGGVFKDGIIYFITDKDVPDRGKIGRTMNTDVKKLKSRYSIFGKPDILCYFSSDIIADEAALKKSMREAGCMESNTEMISNVSLAREVFYEFVEK